MRHNKPPVLCVGRPGLQPEQWIPGCRHGQTADAITPLLLRSVVVKIYNFYNFILRIYKGLYRGLNKSLKKILQRYAKIRKKILQEYWFLKKNYTKYTICSIILHNLQPCSYQLHCMILLVMDFFIFLNRIIG